MSDVYDKIYEIVKEIPSGRVASYGSIARCLGMKSGARMVGWAMNNCHHKKDFIPAHRVVNRLGILTGKHHFGGENTMKELLESEGLQFDGDQILNFKKHFWDPFVELSLKD